MKRLFVLLALLAPLSAAAESENYKTENEVCSLIIPSIYESYNMRDVVLKSNDKKYNKQVQTINCKYKAIALDSRGNPAPATVKATLNMSTDKARIGWAFDKGVGEAKNQSQCKNLIADITSKYDVTNLVLMYDGGSGSSPYANCVYSATKPEVWGDRPIQLTVLLNKATGRYTIE